MYKTLVSGQCMDANISLSWKKETRKVEIIIVQILKCDTTKLIVKKKGNGGKSKHRICEHRHEFYDGGNYFSMVITVKVAYKDTF